MNNILRLPQAQTQGQRTGQTQQANPVRAIVDRYMRGMRPDEIIGQMAGPEAQQARKIIGGKSPAQLKTIAQNMAQQRGVKLEELAAQLGVRLPE